MQTGFRTNFSWKRGFSMMLLTLFSFSVAVAQVLVRGTVVDQTGESVPGASIQIKGGTQGTITDLDGKFSLNAPNKKSILIVSFIGYVTQELPVETAKPMSIILKEDTKTLDEVVIVGYQEVKKKDLTGAVAKVNMEDLLKTPASSFDQTLGGRIAGVNVSSGEGMPGGTMNIVIRGNNSLTQDNSPLYVIDGFPVEDPAIAATINPSDAESVEVLKDASATAIYGTRGINGVIVLKLKTPQQMKEEKTIKQIDELLKPRGVDRRNARYYINGKEVPASTAYQTNIEQMEVKTGADGTLEIYIKPMIFIRGEYE